MVPADALPVAQAQKSWGGDLRRRLVGSGLPPAPPASALSYAIGGPCERRGVRIAGRHGSEQSGRRNPVESAICVGLDRTGAAGSTTAPHWVQSSQQSCRAGSSGLAGSGASPAWKWQIGTTKPAMVAGGPSGAAISPRPKLARARISVRAAMIDRRTASVRE